MPPFPVLDVTGWDFLRTEPAGTKIKFWLTEPGTEDQWMFRQVVVHRNGNRQGEDWAEKIAAEVASLLQVPAARAELATRNGQAGVVLRDLRPATDWEHQPGAVLLEQALGEFDPKDPSQYTLEVIREVLADVGPPPGFLPTGMTAFDVFTGFLLLDALIANRDRHARNWSVLRDPYGSAHLMGCYDHASALNYGASDDSRASVLRSDPDLSRWCGRGTAHAFRDGDSVTLVELSRRALAMASPAARDLWLANVTRITVADLETLIAAIPTLSPVGATFALTLLTTNRRRILDA